MALSGALGDAENQAGVLGWLGRTASAAGDYDVALARLREALALRRPVRGWRGALETASFIGHVAVMRGDGARAMPLLRGCLALWQEHGVQWNTLTTRRWMATTARRAGDAPVARALCLDSLRLCVALRNPLVTVETLEEYVLDVLAGEQWARGARLYGATAAWREKTGLVPWGVVRAHLSAAVAAGRRALGEGEWLAAEAAGGALTPERALVELLATEGVPTAPAGAEGADEAVAAPSAVRTPAGTLAMPAQSVSGGAPAGVGIEEARARALEEVLDAAEALCAALLGDGAG